MIQYKIYIESILDIYFEGKSEMVSEVFAREKVGGGQGRKGGDKKERENDTSFYHKHLI